MTLEWVKPVGGANHEGAHRAGLLASFLLESLAEHWMGLQVTSFRPSRLRWLYGATLGVLAALLVAGSVLPGVVTAEFFRQQPAPVELADTIFVKDSPEIRVPIVHPGGIIDAKYPDGVPMNWPGAIYPVGTNETIALIEETAQAAELEDWVIHRLLAPYRHSPNAPEDPAYPYEYPSYDQATAQISVESILNHHDDLVELSSALLYAERAPAAFSLLNRIRSVENSCEIQVNLAQTVALGFAPKMKNVESEFEQAIDICEDSPIALVAYAQARLGFDTRAWQPPEDRLPYHLGKPGDEHFAVSLAQEAQSRFPTDPIGYETEATILLEVADKFSGESVYPFTARHMYERALMLLNAVSIVESANPTVTFGRARALAGLHRESEAAEIASTLAPSFTNEVERNNALEDAKFIQLDLGNAGEALRLADLISNPWVTPFAPVTGCRSVLPVGSFKLRGTMGAPEPGWLGMCHSTLVDATGNKYPSGADSLDFIDYIPQYRTASPSRDNLLVVAGRAEEARARVPSNRFQAMLDGRWQELFPEPDGSIDAAQDTYRRLGRYSDAEQLIETALEMEVGDPGLLHNRLGEVLYLQQNYETAAAEFQVASQLELEDAADLAWRNYTEEALGPEWSSIKQAAALYQDGRLSEALAVLSALTVTDPGSPHAEWDYAAIQVAQSTLVGTIELEMESYGAAAVMLQEAIDVCEPWLGRDSDICGSGVQHNNLAVALLKSGRPDDAADAAREAIARDPGNPMFAEALANAFEESDDAENAAQAYRDTILIDPTQTTAQNNLGAILAEQGQLTEAIDHFMAAIQSKPEYAPAWFNLGVAFSADGSLKGFLLSQGALGQAAGLSSEFRDVDSTWYSDKNVYDPGLDLSKPLPADWSAGAARHRAPTNPAVLVVAFVSLLVSSILTDKAKSRLTDSALKRLASSKLLIASRVAIVVDSLAVAAVAAVVMLRSLGFSPWIVLTGVLLGLSLSGVFVLSRQVADGRLQHSMHTGAVVVGLIGAPFGVPVVPVPILQDDISDRLRLRPYFILGAFAIAALGLLWWSRIPLMRSALEVIVLALASGAIAIAPFDGKSFSRPIALAAAVLVGAIGILLAVYWI